MQLPSEKNRWWINYLLIVLGFLLIAFGIYLFFKFKIKAIEKENTSAYQTYDKTYVNSIHGRTNELFETQNKKITQNKLYILHKTI